MKARLSLPPERRAQRRKVIPVVLEEHAVELRDPETGTALTLAPIEFVREP